MSGYKTLKPEGKDYGTGRICKFKGKRSKKSENG